MAVRLQIRLGTVPEEQRLADSPDRVLVVEPTVGAVSRSKGSLYLLVTCRQSGKGPREATRFVAEAIREHYYYDESAGIRVCIAKAIVAASKRLAHDRDRFGLHLDQDGNGPVGVGVAVVRGPELYVATVGPAEAYLVRGGRLSTLPDPHRERGLPSPGIEPEAWRGEILADDVLTLVSPNLTSRLETDELRDAMTSLRPRSAMEHLHHRFVASGGRGSDGALAIEASEVALTERKVTLVPLRPPEPLAGAPERSPIPLADTVSGSVAVVRDSARDVGTAVGEGAGRFVDTLIEALPARDPGGGRVTSTSARRRTQRRVAIGVIGLVAVLAVGAVSAYLGRDAGQDDIGSLTAGQRALREAQQALADVSANGVDLVRDDPVQAEQLLGTAYQRLADARTAGIPASTIDPLKAETVVALDRLYRMIDVAPTVRFSFASLKGVDLRALVRGPDGAPYVLDAGSRAVYRIDLASRKAVPIIRAGTAAAGTKVGIPKLLTVGGPDLLLLDEKNVLWRWRPADRTGKGTLTRVRVVDSVRWGPDIRAIGTFTRDAEAGLYNLYVVDPSEKQILKYPPASDGYGFPAAPSGYLKTALALEGVSQLLIDGDLFTVDSGAVLRYVSGTSRDWRPQVPPDAILRPAPTYGAMAAGPSPRKGSVYAWDRVNDRVVALDKATGRFVAQYRLVDRSDAWGDVRGMLLDLSTSGAPTLWWIDGSRLVSALLAPAGTGASDGTGPGDATSGETTAGTDAVVVEDPAP